MRVDRLRHCPQDPEASFTKPSFGPPLVQPPLHFANAASARGDDRISKGISRGDMAVLSSLATEVMITFAPAFPPEPEPDPEPELPEKGYELPGEGLELLECEKGLQQPEPESETTPGLEELRRLKELGRRARAYKPIVVVIPPMIETADPEAVMSAQLLIELREQWQVEFLKERGLARPEALALYQLRVLAAMLALNGEDARVAISGVGGVRWAGKLLAAVRAAADGREEAGRLARLEEDRRNNLENAGAAERHWREEQARKERELADWNESRLQALDEKRAKAARELRAKQFGEPLEETPPPSSSSSEEEEAFSIIRGKTGEQKKAAKAAAKLAAAEAADYKEATGTGLEAEGLAGMVLYWLAMGHPPYLGTRVIAEGAGVSRYVQRLKAPEEPGLEEAEAELLGWDGLVNDYLAHSQKKEARHRMTTEEAEAAKAVEDAARSEAERLAEEKRAAKQRRRAAAAAAGSKAKAASAAFGALEESAAEVAEERALEEDEGLDFEEFCELEEETGVEEMDEEELRARFNAIDEDGSGKITMSELMEYQAKR